MTFEIVRHKQTPEQNLPKLEKVLVIGRGGRENALAWAFSQFNGIKKIYVAPGNGGTAKQNCCHCLNIEESNSSAIIKACKDLTIDLVVIGGEKPLASGLADKLRDAKLTVFGPGADGAQLEASKNWAKELMEEASIPTAHYWKATSEEDALSILNTVRKPLVVKADGLASGKGVTVCNSIEETKLAIQKVFTGKFGEAGSKIILEECLQGPEVSIFAISDGKSIEIMPPAQDHKRLLDGDKGPNTGGMGAYAPAKIINSEELKEIKEKILDPTLKALIRRNIDYRGVIYAGLMLTKDGPKVIEYNCRFGDPECQALMPLMDASLARVLQSAALGSLNRAPKLSVKPLISVCVIASTSGYPEKPKTGDLISIDLDQNNDLPVQLFHSGTKLNEQGNLITSGGRVLSIVAQGNNYEDAFKTVYKAVKLVNFNGIFYRYDIGYQVRSDDLNH